MGDSLPEILQRGSEEAVSCATPECRKRRMKKALYRLPGAILFLTIHLPLALFASPIIGTVCIAFVGYRFPEFLGIRSEVGQRLLGDIPYSPIIWGSGIMLGFLVNRKTRSTSACWVGVVGILLLVLSIGYFHKGYESSVYAKTQTNNSYWTYTNNQLFTLDLRKCGGGECLGELFFTTPVVSSIGYSIGALLGLRLARPKL